MYVLMRVRMYGCINIYIYTHTKIHMCVCAFMYALMRLRMSACVCTHVYVCVYVYVCMHVCVYVSEMKQQSVELKCEFSGKHSFISLWNYTRSVKLKTRSGPKQKFNWTSYAAVCTDIFARSHCRKRKDAKRLPSLILQEFSGVLCNTHSENGSTISNIKIWAGHTIKLCEPHVWQPSLQGH